MRTRLMTELITYKNTADRITHAEAHGTPAHTEALIREQDTNLERTVTALQDTFPWITEVSPTMFGSALTVDGAPTTDTERAQFTDFTRTLADLDEAALYTLMFDDDAACDLIPENHRI